MRSAFAFVFSAVAAAVLGCASPEPAFTPEEKAMIEDLRLTSPPPDPSNRYADDPRAIALGKQLFFDRRFAGPIVPESAARAEALGKAGEMRKVACIDCHDVGRGGADTRSRGPTSVGARISAQNAPSLLNVAYQPTWYRWPGNRDSLWRQAMGPIESANFNNSRLTAAHVIFDHYKAPYEAIFGPLPPLSDTKRFPLVPDDKPELGRPKGALFEGMTEEDRTAVNRVVVNYAKALAAYERQLVDRDSPFDRWVDGKAEIDAAAIRGARLFIGRARCNECHLGPILSDYDFHNLGVQDSSKEGRGRIDAAEEILKDPFNRAGKWSDAPAREHLDSLTPPADGSKGLGAFKTPTLRNVTKTAPYFHTGNVGTLREVLVFYNEGGGKKDFFGDKDRRMRPLKLTDAEIDDLLAFLETLEGDPLPASILERPALPP